MDADLVGMLLTLFTACAVAALGVYLNSELVVVISFIICYLYCLYMAGKERVR